MAEEEREEEKKESTKSTGRKKSDLFLMSHKGNKKYSLPSINKRYKVEEVKKVIYDCYGVRTYICATLDCTQD